MFIKRCPPIALMIAICWAIPFGSGAEEGRTPYLFGVLSQRSAVLTAQHWNPILDYVTRRTGIPLQLRIARTAPESNQAIASGDYDFVYSNTIFTPENIGQGYQVILRPRVADISSQIVTLEDSPIHTLKDLDGRVVGFPSLAAFVGYAVPMDHLLRQGLKVTPVFGGNQEGIMAQLQARRVIAAGVNSLVMRRFASRKNLKYRVLWESQMFHNLPVAVHPRVEKPVADAVQKTLAAMAEDPEGARVLEQSAQVIKQKPPYGFLSSHPEAYANYLEFYRNTLVKDIK